MSLSLKKGGNVNLSKEAPGATKMRIGLGWSARAGSGAAFDLDASAFMLAANGKVRGDDDMIFTTSSPRKTARCRIQGTT